MLLTLSRTLMWGFHLCKHIAAMLRSYHPEYPRSRPITEGKLDWARSVLRWVTTREYLVL